MDAISLKRETEKHIDDIANLIASFYGEENRDKIVDRIKNMKYYFYDSNKQISRLLNIELKNIASEFASELTIDLNVNEKRKQELTNELAELILHNATNNEILNFVISNEELADNINEYSKKIAILKEYYRNDYKTREIKSNIDFNSFTDKVDDYSVEFVKKYFHMDIDKKDASYLVEKFMNVFSNGTSEDIEEFYELIGCKGKDLAALKRNAKLRNVYVNEERFSKLTNEYFAHLDELVIETAFEGSNLDEIIKDLESQGYDDIPKKDLAFYLARLNTYRAITYVNGSENRERDSFIIYSNDDYVYSPKFIDTFIHEILHYIGEQTNVKKGLNYVYEGNYIYLEEGYVNYCAKVLSNQYLEEHGPLIKTVIDRDYPSSYDVTLPYMEKVFELYGEALRKIHIEDLSFEEANKLCPMKVINDSIARIHGAEFVNDSIIKEEINRLTKRKGR